MLPLWNAFRLTPAFIVGSRPREPEPFRCRVRGESGTRTQVKPLGMTGV